MSDIVERLRAPANWLRQDKGSEWKNAINSYDRTPFEAAAEITRLRAALWEIKRKLLVQSCTCSFVVDDIITRTEGGR